MEAGERPKKKKKKKKKAHVTIVHIQGFVVPSAVAELVAPLGALERIGKVPATSSPAISLLQHTKSPPKSALAGAQVQQLCISTGIRQPSIHQILPLPPSPKVAPLKSRINFRAAG